MRRTKPRFTPGLSILACNVERGGTTKLCNFLEYLQPFSWDLLLLQEFSTAVAEERTERWRDTLLRDPKMRGHLVIFNDEAIYDTSLVLRSGLRLREVWKACHRHYLVVCLGQPGENANRTLVINVHLPATTDVEQFKLALASLETDIKACPFPYDTTVFGGDCNIELAPHMSSAVGPNAAGVQDGDLRKYILSDFLCTYRLQLHNTFTPQHPNYTTHGHHPHPTDPAIQHPYPPLLTALQHALPPPSIQQQFTHFRWGHRNKRHNLGAPTYVRKQYDFIATNREAQSWITDCTPIATDHALIIAHAPSHYKSAQNIYRQRKPNAKAHQPTADQITQINQLISEYRSQQVQKPNCLATVSAACQHTYEALQQQFKASSSNPAYQANTTLSQMQLDAKRETNPILRGRLLKQVAIYYKRDAKRRNRKKKIEKLKNTKFGSKTVYLLNDRNEKQYSVAVWTDLVHAELRPRLFDGGMDWNDQIALYNTVLSELQASRLDGMSQYLRIPWGRFIIQLAMLRATAQPGPDGVPAWFLRALQPQQLLWIHQCFERALNGQPLDLFPQEWRDQHATGVPKIRSPTAADLRWLCSQPCLSKWFFSTVLALPLPEVRPLPSFIVGYRGGMQPQQVSEAIKLLFQKTSEWQRKFYVVSLDVFHAFEELEIQEAYAALRSRNYPLPVLLVLLSDLVQRRVTYHLNSQPLCTLQMRRSTSTGGVPSTTVWNSMVAYAVEPLLEDWHRRGLALTFDGDVHSKLVLQCFADNFFTLADSYENAITMARELAQTLRKHKLRIKPSSLQLLANIPAWEDFNKAGHTGTFELDPERNFGYGEGLPVQSVAKMAILGTLVDREGRDRTAYEHRLACAHHVWRREARILCNKRLPLSRRLQRYQDTVVASALYGAGSWNLLQAELGNMRTWQLQHLRAMLCLRKPPLDKWPEFFKQSATVARTKFANAGHEPITVRARRLHHRFAGHFVREDTASNLLAFTLSIYDNEEWRVQQAMGLHHHRRPGPAQRFENTLERVHGMLWKQAARDRKAWRTLEDEFAKATTRRESDWLVEEPCDKAVVIEAAPAPQRMQKLAARALRRTTGDIVYDVCQCKPTFNEQILARKLQCRNVVSFSNALRIIRTTQTPKICLAFVGDNKSILDYAGGRGRLSDSRGRDWVDGALEQYRQTIRIADFPTVSKHTSHFWHVLRRANRGADFLCNQLADSTEWEWDDWCEGAIVSFLESLQVGTVADGEGERIRQSMLLCRFDGGFKPDRSIAVAAGLFEFIESSGKRRVLHTFARKYTTEQITDSFEAEAMACSISIATFSSLILNMFSKTV